MHGHLDLKNRTNSIFHLAGAWYIDNLGAVLWASKLPTQCHCKERKLCQISMNHHDLIGVS